MPGFRTALSWSIVVLLISLGSACSVRPKAGTVLEITSGKMLGKPVKIGFREVFWRTMGQDVQIVGSGWRADEHDTILMFVMEGYPIVRRRYLKVEKSVSDTYFLSIAFGRHADPSAPTQSSEYSGPLPDFHWEPDKKVRINLDAVVIENRATGEFLTVSGRIVAKPTTTNVIESNQWYYPHFQ